MSTRRSESRLNKNEKPEYIEGNPSKNNRKKKKTQ